MMNGYAVRGNVGVICTTNNRKYYVLTVDAVGKSGPHEYLMIAGPDGKPKMWTRLEYAVKYAEDNGIDLRRGYRFMGGGSDGNPKYS